MRQEGTEREMNSGTEKEKRMKRSSIKEAVACYTFQTISRNMLSGINPQQIFGYKTNITIRLLILSSYKNIMYF